MKTKFDVLQTVWFMYENKPKSAQVTKIIVNRRADETYQLDESWERRGNELFASKEELKDSIFS